MPTLQEVLNVVSQIGGVFHLHKIREAYDGKVKIYAVFQHKDNRIWIEEIAILVLNEGTETETAECYDLSRLQRVFENALMQKIGDIQTANQAIEKVRIDNVDEKIKLAYLTAFIYDSTAKKTTEKRYVAFDQAGELKVREVA